MVLSQQLRACAQVIRPLYSGLHTLEGATILLLLFGWIWGNADTATIIPRVTVVEPPVEEGDTPAAMASAVAAAAAARKRAGFSASARQRRMGPAPFASFEVSC
ncbi:hypothetical protein B566_EDAN005509 [Ephemera danica]|nr:hypothetical protein B566_EDAN005509 [Ephemera danica]